MILCHKKYNKSNDNISETTNNLQITKEYTWQTHDTKSKSIKKTIRFRTVFETYISEFVSESDNRGNSTNSLGIPAIIISRFTAPTRARADWPEHDQPVDCANSAGWLAVNGGCKASWLAPNKGMISRQSWAQF